MTDLRALLLDLLFRPDAVDRGRLGRLRKEDWVQLVRMLSQHRQAAYLHWKLQGVADADDMGIPGEVWAVLEQSRRQGVFRILRIQQDLITLDKILSEAGIPYAFLKGAYLAWHVYPEPGVRILRDIDLIVPRATAMDAWERLLDAGWLRLPSAYQNPAESLQCSKDLPRLVLTDHSVPVEVHARLFARRYEPELSDDPGFWERRIEVQVGEHRIWTTSPTDCLLHMVHHAVINDRFRNGPVLLSDIAYLVAQQRIDWPLFWRLVERTKTKRAVMLAFALTERFFGKLPIPWSDDESRTDAEVAAECDRAVGLMLRDVVLHKENTLRQKVTDARTWGQKAGLVFRNLLPSPHYLSERFGVSPSGWNRLACYPRHWWDIGVRRGPFYLSTPQDPVLKDELRQLKELREWLEDER